MALATMAAYEQTFPVDFVFIIVIHLRHEFIFSSESYLNRKARKITLLLFHQFVSMKKATFGYMVETITTTAA